MPNDGASSSIPPLHPRRFEMELIRESAANWIMMHEHPFTILEEVGFNLMMKRGWPKWKKISRNTSKSDCLKVYEIKKKKLKNNLENGLDEIQHVIGDVRDKCGICEQEAKDNLAKVKEIINILYEEYVVESMNKENSKNLASSNTFRSQVSHQRSAYTWEDFNAYCAQVEIS
nr:zinc finger BED domain-containing protein RICESLEEPER 2-like [Ipomoea batatas]